MAHTFRRLEDLCDIRSGGTPRRGTSGLYSGKIPWAKIADLDSPDGIVHRTEESITDAGLEAIGGRLFPPETLLLAMYGSVGKLATSGVELATNQAILGIQVNSPDVLDAHYLRRWLESIQEQLVHRARGVTQKNLSAKIVRNLQIPVPSLMDQKRIATILDKADAIRRKRQQAIALTEDLLRSTFLEMFGEYFREEASKRFIEVSGVLVDCRNKTAPYTASGIPLIRTTNFRSQRLDLSSLKYVSEETSAVWSARHQTAPGDIVYCREAPFGMAAIVPDGLEPCLGQRIMVCRPNQDEVRLRYLHQALNSEHVFRQADRVAVGATVRHLRVKDVENLLVPVPPIDLQDRFVAISERVNQMYLSGVDGGRASENLFGSLSQRAFRGEL